MQRLYFSNQIWYHTELRSDIVALVSGSRLAVNSLHVFLRQLELKCMD